MFSFIANHNLEKIWSYLMLLLCCCCNVYRLAAFAFIVTQFNADFIFFVHNKYYVTNAELNLYSTQNKVYKAWRKLSISILKHSCFSPYLLWCSNSKKWKSTKKMKLNLHRWPPNPVSHPLLLSSLTRRDDLFFWCISSKGLFDCSCLSFFARLSVALG